MEAGVTGADIAVIGIVALAGLVAMALGFVRVVLALAGWVGAVFATLYGFAYVRPFAREWISSPLLADAAAGATVFIGTLVVITFISHAIGRRVRQSGLSALDRSLGLVLGLFLGGVIVSLAYLALVWAIDLPPRAADQPEWIREARTRPLVELGAASLSRLAPPEWRRLERGGQGGAARGGSEAERVLQRLLEPETNGRAPNDRPGYTDRERQEMDRLIRGQ
jgi:membrane protein required for colicin V production